MRRHSAVMGIKISHDMLSATTSCHFLSLLRFRHHYAFARNHIATHNGEQNISPFWSPRHRQDELCASYHDCFIYNEQRCCRRTTYMHDLRRRYALPGRRYCPRGTSRIMLAERRTQRHEAMLINFGVSRANAARFAGWRRPFSLPDASPPARCRTAKARRRSIADDDAHLFQDFTLPISHV